MLNSIRRRSCRSVFALAILLANPVIAGPVIEAGDLALRHDIQRLADYGMIKGPTTTWPLAWGPILEDLQQADISTLPADVADAIGRVRSRADWDATTNQLVVETKVAVAESPSRIRSFQNTPRGKVEVSAGLSWTGDWLGLDLNIQGVDSEQDKDEFRADNSMIGVVSGNWSISVNTMERWWGPGWDGSIILSNNARPFPSLTIDRVFTDAFSSKWLSWIGPWDLSVTFGELESRRQVRNARFFGMRFNFRPLRSLEVGVSRTAEWCGDGRPCDVETFAKLLIGRDNQGDAGITVANEPSNQMAGVDFRWSTRMFDMPIAFYGQFIGEDEAGGFPSRWLGQIGGDWSGYLFDRWSTRIFGEFAGTSCQFYESSAIFNCAYNHSIYQTGHRYRGRAIGHGSDNDARVISAGISLQNAEESKWFGALRFGTLNRGGSPDPNNSLTPTKQDIASIDVSHSRALRFGTVVIGAGVERINDIATGREKSDGRFYVQWRSSY